MEEKIKINDDLAVMYLLFKNAKGWATVPERVKIYRTFLSF
jgi:hypothetical protein